ncbi:MAG: hypothetical protein WC002_08770, partial [Candidatus Muiribacteriota bacterium]
MNQKLKINLAIILIIVAWAVYTLYPVNEKINLGLDLKGGMDLVYEIDMHKLKELTIERKAAKIRKTLDENNILDYSVEEKSADLEINVRVFDSNVDEEKNALMMAQIEEDDLMRKVRGNLQNGLVMGIPENLIVSMNQDAVSKAVQVIR